MNKLNEALTKQGQILWMNTEENRRIVNMGEEESLLIGIWNIKATITDMAYKRQI